MKHLIITIYFVFISFLIRGYKGEYYIKHSSNPSYLYKYFDAVEESVFPREMKINMSLSTLSGIIIYSIDQNMNQLIVSISDSKEVTLTIEFNKKTFHLSLSQLCGCRQCRYEVIEIQIQMREDINIWCNEGRHKSLEYGLSKELNEHYPNPFSKAKRNHMKKNAAHLWIVNHQQYGDIFPNGNQISGCIFNISYIGKNIAFKNLAGDIGLQCHKACKEGICNGGDCFETFNEEPVCDCTWTFKNGRYCNDMMTPKSLKSTNQLFKFKIFKLSWMTSANDIFSLSNEWRHLRLFRKGFLLKFEYKNMMSGGFNVISVLSENYASNGKYILVVSFLTDRINCSLKYNNTLRSIMILTDQSLPNEIFTNLVLRSGRGIIDFVYIVSEKFHGWSDLDIRHFSRLRNEQLINFINISKNHVGCQDNAKLYIVIVGLVAVNLICVLLFIIITRRCKMKLSKIIEETKESHDTFPLLEVQMKESHETIPLLKGTNKVSNDQELKLRNLTKALGPGATF